MFPGMLIRLFIGTTLFELTKDSISFKSLIFESENTSLYIALGVCAVLIFIVGFTYISRVTKKYIEQIEIEVEQLELS